MPLVRLSAVAAAALLSLAGAVWAADGPGEFGGIEVSVGPVPAHLVTNQDLAKLPPVQVSLTLGVEHDPHQATYEGPSLWSVLDQAGEGAVGTRDLGRRYITITGHDGYVVVLSVGEVAPAYEGKQVILANSIDGHPLPPGRWRLVIPGDHAAGRSVRDVASLAVVSLPSGS